MAESRGQSGSNGGTTNSQNIRPDDVLVGFDPDGTNSDDLARSNTLREVASTLATDTNMAVGQALNTAQTAADAAVKTSGDQTIADVKTFTSIPILPAANPTGLNDAVRKKYVDDVVQGLAEWEVSVAYTHPVMVTGSDGNPYVSLQDSTGVDPVTDTDASHWKRFGTSEQATETLAGLVELATQEEADAGTDTERAMTPALVKRVADNIGPPPFNVPSGPACIEDCDDAPLGWSTPAVGAANLPAGAQGGEGDMIGCWQVAPGTDPHGDSANSAQEEIMQLYVSADGAGDNEGIWFRVRDGSFTKWTNLSRTGAPPGTIIDFAGASAPAGYLACDGTAVSRDTYAGLFAAIGTAWGAGDGSTTFNLPNLQGRFRWGAGGNLSVGNVGGETEVVLTTSQMPVHSHSDGSLATTSGGSHSHGSGTYAAASAGSHVHGNRQYAGGDSGGAEYDVAKQRRNSTTYAIQNTESAGSHSHGVSGSTGSRGSGQAHNNLPPYATMLVCIKT